MMFGKARVMLYTLFLHSPLKYIAAGAYSEDEWVLCLQTMMIPVQHVYCSGAEQTFCAVITMAPFLGQAIWVRRRPAYI